MILLTKNSSNTVIFTATENVTITGSSVYFLFKLSNENRPDYYFTGTDISDNLNRYNKFIIIETAVTYSNLTASTINLNEGSYDYNIYQQLSPTNLSITGITGVSLESGRLYVSATTPSEIITKKYTNNRTIKRLKTDN